MTIRKVKSAGIYCRISQDRNGEALGVERQEKLCRKLAKDKGWPVAEVYVDNDVSAFSGKRREHYERMLNDLKNHVRDAVVVVDQDRLTRAPRELEDFIDLADSNGIALASVSGEVDLGTSDGRFRARIMGTVGRQESEKKSERVKRQRDQAAQAGTFSGGKRPYGYEADGVTIRKSEAKMIREAARRVLAGGSVRQVVIDFNARGIPSASGNIWRVASLKGILTGPRLAGLRVHRGEVEGVAAWAPIVDRKTYEGLCAVISDPQRKQGGRPARHLLSGIVRCSKCGRPMYSAGRSNGILRYVCPSPPNGCNGTVITAAPLHEVITSAVLFRLDTPVVRKAANKKPTKRQADEVIDLAVIERKLDDLAADYGNEKISKREWMAARVPLEQRRDDARREIRAASTTPALNDFADGDVAKLWAKADIEKRRAVLGALIERIEIGPGKKGRQPFDPARVDISWRV